MDEKELVIYKKGELRLHTTVTNGFCDYTGGKRPEAYLDELGPGFVCIPLGQALSLIRRTENEKSLDMPWREINEEQWNEWLEVLPSEKFQSVNEVDIFRLCERQIRKITLHCAQYRGRFFSSYQRTTESYKHMAAQIKTICHDGGAE